MNNKKSEDVLNIMKKSLANQKKDLIKLIETALICFRELEKVDKGCLLGTRKLIKKWEKQLEELKNE